MTTRTFQGTGAPAQARRFCTSHLLDGLSDDGPAEEAISQASLVVSELVTHAVTRGASSVAVSVELHRSHVQLAVRDDAPGPESEPAPDGSRELGLLVVDALSRSWGAQPLDGGRRVWAIIAVPEAATRGLDCVVDASG